MRINSKYNMETIREQSEISQSMIDPDAQSRYQKPSPPQFEKVLETQSLFTETDGYSFENNEAKDPTASLGKQISKNPYQDLQAKEKERNNDSRYQSSKEALSSFALSHNPNIRIIPSQADNPMQSIRHEEYFQPHQILSDKGSSSHQKNDSVHQAGYSIKQNNHDPYILRINSDEAYYSNQPGSILQQFAKQAQTHKKNLSEERSPKIQSANLLDKDIKPVKTKIPQGVIAPKMHLKETIQYKAAQPMPTINIFEEIPGTPGSTPLKTSPGKQGQQVYSFEQRKSFGEIRQPEIVPSPRMGGNKMLPLATKLDKQIENDQKAKDEAFKKFKETYEKRLQMDQMRKSQQDIGVIKEDKLQIKDENQDFKPNLLKIPPNKVKQISSSKQEKPKSVKFAEQIQETKLISPEPKLTPSRQNSSPRRDFEMQVSFEKDTKPEPDHFAHRENEIPQLLAPQISLIQEDPSGTYTHLREEQDIRTLVKQTELSKVRLNCYPAEKKKDSEISILRKEMMKNAQNRKRGQLKDQLMKGGSLSGSINMNTRNSGNQSLAVYHTQEVQTQQPSVLLESLSRDIMMQATADPQIFKNILMKFLCEGYTFEIKKLFNSAPRNNPKFFDCKEFYFAMFNHQVGKAKESRMVSPIGLAACIGDPLLLTTLIEYFTQEGGSVNLEFGIEIKVKSQTVLKQYYQFQILISLQEHTWDRTKLVSAQIILEPEFSRGARNFIQQLHNINTSFMRRQAQMFMYAQAF